MRILLILFCFHAFADVTEKIEIPFPKIKQTVLVELIKSRCTVKGEKAFSLQTIVPNQEYALVCKLRPPVDKFDFTMPITLVENFHYPESILQDIQASPFDEIKNLGEKLIRKTPRPWGTEYLWSNMREGTTVYSYLCPKKSKHCFRAIYGGIEFFNFEVKNDRKQR